MIEQQTEDVLNLADSKHKELALCRKENTVSSKKTRSEHDFTIDLINQELDFSTYEGVDYTSQRTTKHLQFSRKMQV